MLDHALGRPSAGLKRIQVLVFAFIAYRIIKSPKAGPNMMALRYLDEKFASLPPWKIVFGTLSIAWILKNFFLTLGLNAPEPLARMYTRNFYRASYVLTSLDAGFLTAMNVRPKFLRDILSVLFAAFYLVFPDTADEKVRKFRAHPTIEMMRVSWEKSMNPYLRLATAADRPYVAIREDIIIERPDPPSVSSFPDRELGPIKARLYFTGTRDELRRSRELILLLPGGGFVAMPPKCHEDYVSQWAVISKVPIVAIEYGKAPEFPYPFALEECFDAYRSIVESNGGAIGFEGWYESDAQGHQLKKAPIKIVMVGDSAGGNLVVGVVMRCLETYEKHIPPPNGLVLIYPCLSFDMSCWMPSEQLKLMRAESHKNLSLKSLSESKHNIKKNSPLTPQEAPRKIDVLKDEVDRSKSWYHIFKPRPSHPPGPSIPSSLSMTSRMSYFTDRIITPEMMRAMALLYLGTSPVPVDLASDYYLSPVMAPDDLLARFPKTYLLCGEKDPFVDDTVVFAGRLRENKQKARKEWERMMRKVEHGGGVEALADKKQKQKLAQANGTHMNGTANGTAKGNGAAPERVRTHIFSRDPDTMVRVKILEGVSHAMFQMLSLLPEAKQATRMTAEWFTEILKDPGVDDHGDDLTEFMIRDIHQRDRAPSGPQVGPYYPAYGVPQHAPCPHIRVDGTCDPQGSHRSLNGSVNGLHAEDRYGSTGSVRFEGSGDEDAYSDLSDSPDPIPILDEVDEKHILERRRTEIGSLLYSIDG
ncbi:uncharacterized protein SPPG_04049 [Spizellomyces punctatus DAOM BR117]|uniref:Alpha/beta hydrolase fold-3 domain-containing protein n=1 Tax=Spizellomyces punctatus (strain DAOM BR117) TaxID=645134 RepID=A0A0L0HIT8_SPIPD|nr:uncharacterized protein SPPG_04049 [Spizellomyces punctatus DAOM BR117]KND00948.1 hypothetical protein SPPG_04049 [Spizellomyces punctatus DAOM BR117]|eukprot:XP_016608987.1 hypothetical protein SPPG_04049 [Spizellomyces punctatus DAOM BR117]